MKFVTKRQHPKPVADSNPWAVRRKKAKQPKFNDKDFNRMSELVDFIGLSRYRDNTGWNAIHGTSAYIEDEDDTSSISSCSTNATMDDIPGNGRTIDKYFYQPVGRAIERFAPKITMRFNFGHPSPAQILRVLQLSPYLTLCLGNAEKPSDVIARISTKQPSAVPGILSLVHQSQ